MTVYQKGGGVWNPATMVYVKVNGIWTPAKNAYVKVGGAWTVAHTYDVTPPDSPEISTEIIDNIVKGKLIGRWIRIGIRGGPVVNTGLRRIRVLTDYNGAMPTNHEGGTFTSASDDGWPSEPWSEWRYNGFGNHGDTTNFTYKQWPRNAKDSVMVKAGTDYHFAAWSEDFAGNWSPIVSRTVSIPKTTDAANVLVKQTRFQANSSGSLPTGTYIDGDLVQRGSGSSPGSLGMWFYGDQINNTIGSQGTPTMRAAQILVNRDANDGGSASANVYLYHHLYRSPAEVPTSGRVFSEVVKLGTIAKGESKWFDIPASHLTDMNTGLRGFGLYNKDPAKASSFADDFSVVKGVASNFRSGEVVATWEEAL